MQTKSHPLVSVSPYHQESRGTGHLLDVFGPSGENLVAIPLEKPFYINSGIVTKKGRQLYEDERMLIDYLKEITKDMM